MPSEWPKRRRKRVRAEADQRITVLSVDAEARRVPSLEYLTQAMGPSWPRRVLRWR